MTKSVPMSLLPVFWWRYASPELLLAVYAIEKPDIRACMPGENPLPVLRFFLKEQDKQKNIPFQQMWLKLCTFPSVTLKFWYRIGNKAEASSILFQYLNLKINCFQNKLFSEFEVRII